MAKNDPKILNYKRIALSKIVSNGFSSESFAVTCGDPMSRLNVFVNVVADAASLEIPIVIIHQGGPIGYYLNSINGIINVGSANPCYTAFNGMNETQVQNAVVALSGGDPFSAEEFEAFSVYFQLAAHNPRLPGTLNALCEIVNTDRNNLGNVLSRINSMDYALQNDIIAALSPYYADGTDISVNRHLRNRLLSVYQNISTISSYSINSTNKVSILDTVNRKGIIAIDTTGSKDALLDYLAEELSAVRAPFFLACCDLTVSDSSAFGKYISKHSGTNKWPLFISSNDILSSYTSTTPTVNFAALLAARCLLILNCGNAITATPYQLYVGEYLKDVVTRSHSNYRQPFRIFGGINDGSSVTQTLMASLQKNDFCNRDGCVFCYNDNIIKAGIIDLTKGIVAK